MTAWCSAKVKTAYYRGRLAPQSTTAASNPGKRPVSGVNVQRFIILLAAIIFAAAGLLLGMSYKHLFPSSQKDAQVAHVQAPKSSSPGEKTPEVKAPGKTAPEEKASQNNTAPPETLTQTTQPVTEQLPKDQGQDQAADEPKAEDQSSSPPESLMKGLIESQYQEIEELKKTVAELQQELVTKNDRIQTLENNAVQVKKENKTRPQARKPVVFLGDDLFTQGQVALSAKGMDLITQLAAKVKSRNKYRLMICGHTDNTNLGPAKAKTYKDNLGLSVARALKVARGLIAAGVPPEMISVCGYGDNKPVMPNNSASNMAKNRRVVISFPPVKAD